MEAMGNTGKSSAASVRPRVVNIGALFTFNSTIGNSAGPALMAAIEDVNADTSILNGTKLNLILQDTNCSGFLGTVEGNSITCIANSLVCRMCPIILKAYLAFFLHNLVYMENA